MKQEKPFLCFISPLAGKNTEIIPTPADLLSERFRQHGYPVLAVSAKKNKYFRLFEFCLSIIIYHKKIDLLILSVYVGKSFFVEDLVSRWAQLFGIPIIMWLHNGLTPTFVSLFPNWSRKVFKRAKVIVAPSAYLPRALRPYGWQVQVIPNITESEEYPYRHRSEISPSLFWMRSFYPYYNPDMALRVLNRLSVIYPHVSLVMAGKDKGLQTDLINYAEVLGLTTNVKFPGFLNFQEKIQAFDKADIFISTNSVDNTPVSIVEAWAMGLPVVSTAVGGIADLIEDGETGLLVPDDDDYAMATAIRRLLENPELVEKISRKGKEKAQKFSWFEVQRLWEEIISEAINGETRRSL